MYKNGNTYSPMRQISEKARGTTSGYFLSDSTIILSPIPSFDFEISVAKIICGKDSGEIIELTFNGQANKRIEDHCNRKTSCYC